MSVNSFDNTDKIFKASNTEQYLETYQPVFAVEDIKCQACPLWKTSFSRGTRRSGVYGRGSGKNGIYFIGEGLGAREVLLGFPFVGDAGDLLSRFLVEVGIFEPDCFITNIIHCRPPDNRAPSAEEARVCMGEHLQKDLPSYPPKFVVLLGNTALKHILNLTKITERRGIWYTGEYAGHKVRIMPTFHPANVLRKPALYDTVKADLVQVKEALTNSQTPGALPISSLPKLHTECINSKKRFVEWVSLLSQFPDLPIRNDLETTGLVFYKDVITSSSFVFEDEKKEWYGFAFLTKPGVKQIHKIPIFDDAATPAGYRNEIEYYSKEEWWWVDLQDPEIQQYLKPFVERESGFDFHNSDHDVKFWWAAGYKIKCRIDTLDAHLMIDENSLHGLKYLVTRHLSEGAGYQGEVLESVGGDVKLLGSAPPEVLLPYNINDGYYTGLLEQYKFTPQIKAEGTWDFFTNHAMPLRRALTKVSYRGVLVDKERVQNKSDEYRKRGQLLEEELFDICHKVFNYASSVQLVEVLYKDLGLPILARTDKGAPSTGKEVLQELADRHPVPKLIEDVRHLRKMLSTYLDGREWEHTNPEAKKVFKTELKNTGGILQYLDSQNRLHVDLKTQGTISGRLSASILLNVPRDPDIRMNFMAPPGWKLIDKDYKQAELVLLAYLSSCPAFIEAVESSDLHQFVLDRLMKRATVLMNALESRGATLKDIRNVAKTVNFRRAYRGGPDELAVQLKLPIEIVQQWYAEWDEAYPEILLWWQEQERQWRTCHMQEGLYGRKKHYPPSLDQSTSSYYDRVSANFPCQNGVADTTNRSIFLFEQEIENVFGWDLSSMYKHPGIIFAVHDDIVVEAPDEIVEETNELLDRIMSLPLPKLGISLKIDTHIIQRWGQDQLETDEKPIIENELERIQH